jgi:hypothetical protein
MKNKKLDPKIKEQYEDEQQAIMDVLYQREYKKAKNKF